MDMEHTVSAFALVFAAALISTILLFIEVMSNMEDWMVNRVLTVWMPSMMMILTTALTLYKDLFYNVVVYIHNI